MAISVVTAGAWTAPTTRTSTVTLPTHSAGQLVLVRIGWKSSTPTTDVAVCNTSGWTKLGQYYDGGGASGNGSGGVLVAAFYKILTSSSETNPVIEYDDATAPTPGALSYVLYSCGSDEVFVAPVGASGAIAAATSYSATMSTHVSARTSDVLDSFAVTNDNTTLNSPNVTQAGLTLSVRTRSPATALSSANSNDISADGCYGTVNSGTSSAAAVTSGSNSVADPGAAWVTRLRVNKLLTIPLLDASAALYAPTIIPDQLLTLPLLESVGDIVRGSTIASDDFSTNDIAVWPNADTGGAWTPGYLANYSSLVSYYVVGGVGLMSAAAAADQVGSEVLQSVSVADVDLQTALGNLLSNDREMFGLAWRIQSAGNHYSAEVFFDNLDAYIYMRVTKTVSGTPSSLIGSPIFVDSSSSGLILRVAHVGSTLKVKVWSGTEPSTWTVEIDESTFTAAGYIGLVGRDYSETSTQFLDFNAYNASLSVTAPALYAPVVERLAASGPQTLTIPFLDATAALYAPTVIPDQFVTLPLLESTPALYAPTLTPKNLVTLPLLDAGPALYQPTVQPTNTLTPPLLDAGPALYAPTLTPKNLVTLPLLESTPALYAPALAPQPVTIQLGLLDAGPDLFAPTVAKVGGALQAVSLDLLDAGPALYAPTVLPQPVTIQLGLLDAGPALYAPTLTPKNTLTLGLLDAGPALYAPVVTPTNTLTLGLLTSTSALYAPTLAPQPVTITLGLLESTPALYAPTLVPVALTIVVPLLDSGSALYAPAVLANQLLTIPFLDAGPALYAPTVQPDQFVTLGLLDAGPALYAPTLTPKNLVTLPLLDAGPALYQPTVQPDQFLTIPLLDAAAALYAPDVVQLAAGVQTISLDLLDASPALFAPTVLPQPVGLTLGLIDGAPALYAPTLVGKNLLTIPFLDAGAALYAPAIQPDQFLTIPFLDAAPTLYAPTVAPVAGVTQALVIPLLDAAPAVYAPSVTTTAWLVIPLLDGAGELYPPVLQNTAVFITGITRDSNGTPLGAVEVHVFRTSDDVEVAQVTSNALGVFSIGVQAGIAHYIVAYKTGTPDRAGTTLNTLVGS